MVSGSKSPLDAQLLSDFYRGLFSMSQLILTGRGLVNLVSFRNFLGLFYLPSCLKSFPAGWDVSLSEETVTHLTQENIEEILSFIVTSFTPDGEVSGKIYLQNMNYKEQNT